jgi:GAF domain-containing protein
MGRAKTASVTPRVYLICHPYAREGADGQASSMSRAAPSTRSIFWIGSAFTRRAGRAAADEYLRQKHVRSVLCLPLVKQSKLIGAL